MPIRGLSERRRPPRLGQIKLGLVVKNDQGIEHAKATDYFVVPEPVATALGTDKPKSLPIVFPVDNPDVIFPQAYKMYRAAGLWCMGDGLVAKRWNDRGNLSELVCPCSFSEPQDGKPPQCKPTATLNFFMPTVPGIGVWQITTRNKTTIVGINSALEMFGSIFGGLRGVPFDLVLEPQQTERWDEKRKAMTKTTIYCLRLTTEKTLLEVMDWRKQLGAPVESLMLAQETSSQVQPAAPVEASDAAFERLMDDEPGDDGPIPGPVEMAGANEAMLGSPPPGIVSAGFGQGGHLDPEPALPTAAETQLGPQAEPQRLEPFDCELYGPSGADPWDISLCISRAVTILNLTGRQFGAYLEEIFGKPEDMDETMVADVQASLEAAERNPEVAQKLRQLVFLTLSKRPKKAKA